LKKRLTNLLMVAALILTALVALAACGGDGKAKASGPEVVAKNLSFKPTKISVKLGAEVTWTFEDTGTSHNVTADDGSFRSENLAEGTFAHRFEKAGSFSYICTIHPTQMRGIVDVRA